MPKQSKRTPAREGAAWLADVFRNETIGGAGLLAAAMLALLLSNVTDSGFYFELRDSKIGPEFLNLNLSLGTWASDALLAVFFFTAGIELKHELVHGSLKEKRKAAVPVAAAIGGMIVPAAIYAVINFGQDSVSGWGIPMATDIAFALAILAVVGRKLPIELRAFLLTLAVVDDLGAIIVIAIFYSQKFMLIPVFGAVILLITFYLLQKQKITGWYIYVPLAIAIWYLVHESGIHATVAGVAMGLLMNMNKEKGQEYSAGDKALHAIHPFSAAIAVPLFAFFASGVNFSSFDLAAITESKLSLGIILGLLVGKPLGVFLFAFLTAKFSKAQLSKEVSWWDIAAIGSLAGVGFTVSLLITELAFVGNAQQSSLGVLAVLIGSFLSAVLASVLLLLRKRIYLGKLNV